MPHTDDGGSTNTLHLAHTISLHSQIISSSVLLIEREKSTITTFLQCRKFQHARAFKRQAPQPGPLSPDAGTHRELHSTSDMYALKYRPMPMHSIAWSKYTGVSLTF